MLLVLEAETDNEALLLLLLLGSYAMTVRTAIDEFLRCSPTTIDSFLGIARVTRRSSLT